MIVTHATVTKRMYKIVPLTPAKTSKGATMQYVRIKRSNL